MTAATYHYVIEGRGANAVPFSVDGTVMADWSSVFNVVNRDAFHKLTNGKAEYGKPGEGGCKGPYTITSFFLKLVLH